MSDMPRVIQAARSGLSAALRVEPEMLYAIDGDNSTPANPEFFTSYTRTELVVELITLTNRVVNDHGAYLNMNSGDDDLADMLVKAIAEIQGER